MRILRDALVSLRLFDGHSHTLQVSQTADAKRLPIMNLMSHWLLGAGALLAILALFAIEYIGVERAARRNAEAEAHLPKPPSEDASVL